MVSCGRRSSSDCDGGRYSGCNGSWVAVVVVAVAVHVVVTVVLWWQLRLWL